MGENARNTLPGEEYTDRSAYATHLLPYLKEYAALDDVRKGQPIDGSKTRVLQDLR